MLVKWEGIVIRGVDYGESSKVVTLFTREHGKLAVMARGAKKAKSRLAAVSQLFTHGYYLCKAGPGSGMPDLSQGDVVDSFKAMRQDLNATAYAAYMAELLDRLTHERETNPYLFQLIVHIFRYLDEGRDAEILCRIFETKMLQVAGISPQGEITRHGFRPALADDGPSLRAVDDIVGNHRRARSLHHAHGDARAGLADCCDRRAPARRLAAAQ